MAIKRTKEAEKALFAIIDFVQDRLTIPQIRILMDLIADLHVATYKDCESFPNEKLLDELASCQWEYAKQKIIEAERDGK